MQFMSGGVEMSVAAKKYRINTISKRFYMFGDWI